MMHAKYWFPILISLASTFETYCQTCLADYNVIIQITTKRESIGFTDDFSSKDADSLITLTISNKSKDYIPISKLPIITYEDERFFTADIFFRTWYLDSLNAFTAYNKKWADIDDIRDPTVSDSVYTNYIKPGGICTIKSNMNPFQIHGIIRPGKYRIQALYRFETACKEDYIAKSNIIELTVL